MRVSRLSICTSRTRVSHETPNASMISSLMDGYEFSLLGLVNCECGETFGAGDYRIVEGRESPAGSCNVDCVTG